MSAREIIQGLGHFSGNVEPGFQSPSPHTVSSAPLEMILKDGASSKPGAPLGIVQKEKNSLLPVFWYNIFHY